MKKTQLILLLILLSILCSLRSFGTEQLKVRVVDVGTGLCCLVKFPDGKCLIYDTGEDYNNVKNLIIDELKSLLGSSKTIEMMILSHTDKDHIGTAGDIIDSFTVRKVIHTGYHKGLTKKKEYSCDPVGATDVYKKLINKISEKGISETNLCCEKRDLDSNWLWGEASIQILCGFGKPLEDWNLKKEAEKINSVSIVMKIEYKGKSVLFCGDDVGVEVSEDGDIPIATEDFLLKNKISDLASDVMIAPHHGAENASSYDFIETIHPKYVIFSAGSKYEHPRKITVNRYLDIMGSYLDDFNSKLSKYIFRTDKGEGHPECDKEKEWKKWGKKDNCIDKIGDDSITVVIKSSGVLSVTQDKPK